MGGDAGDMLKQTAGYAVGGLSALASLRGGGLQNYMLARSRMLSDPDMRATLIDSPFTRGFYGISGSDTGGGGAAQPSDVAAPADARYLPAGGRSYPNIAPLAYNQQVEQEAHRANMIGLTSADPTIRAQSKMAIGVPLSGEEITGPTGHEGIVAAGRQIVGAAGPGSQVQFVPGRGAAITVGSPYIAGNYLDPSAAAIVAARTGKIPVPSPGGGTEFVAPDRLGENEFTDPAAAEAARKPNERTVPTGRTAATVDGVKPIFRNEPMPPAGVKPLPVEPAAKPAAPARAPAQAPAVVQPPAKPAAAPPPPPPPDTSAAPPPAPAPEAAPAPPAPPPPPPHERVILNPDGTFSLAKPPPPPPTPKAAAPRAEATPSPASPLLAAAGPPPPLLQFPGVATPRLGPAVATPAPVMVARAAPPYELVPGAELSGVASGAPPAPAEERAAAPLPVPPAPTAAVPFEQPTPGQPGPAARTPGFPAGSESFTETYPHPAEQGGQLTVSGEVPGSEERKLDFQKRQEEITRDVERRFGKIPEAKELGAVSGVRGTINDLLNNYTPEQRAQYLGTLTPYTKSFWGTDQRYQDFITMNNQIRAGMIAAGVPEKALDDFPTGTERTAELYESKLRGAVNMVDKMIAAPGVFGNMHVADLTPANQQKVVNTYLSAPSTVHFGPYPWDEKTGAPISTQETPTTAPTTTTSPFLVDKRYTVAPPR